MEYNGRRGRRGRNHSRQVPCSLPFGGHNFTPASCKPWSFLSGIYSFLILTSLMSIIYLMLDYHCRTCTAKCDMKSITRNIDDIAKNLSHIKKSYHELELQVSRFSLELPKLEGQIEILEALASTIEGRDLGWNPKVHLTPADVDVYLSKTEDGRNVSYLSSIHLPAEVAV